MNSSEIERYETLIKNQKPSFATYDQAAEGLKDSLKGIIDEQLVDLALERIKSKLQKVEVIQKYSIFKKHAAWYTGPSEEDCHWPALENYLIQSKGWAKGTVKKINQSSTEVVSLLADPNSEKFQYRGLVVGYVQSGKTANMTAVMAKAIDAGYNMIVVLAGLTNKLRRQTQRRIEMDLLERLPDKWCRWTNPEDDGDFRIPNNQSFTHPMNGSVQLCVLKKNVSPLKHFEETLDKTSPVIKKELKVLLIDDECDSASVNAASKEMDVTAINNRIRNIVGKLPSVSYVGYTATPFANVLISPYEKRGHKSDDLYPRDFITSLELPEGYFGTEKLFGRNAVDADKYLPEEEGLDMIRTIPENDISFLQPARRDEKDEFIPYMTESLENAVLYYLATCAARLVRGHKDAHMTMLVHTSVYTILHKRVSDIISSWIDKIRNDLINSTGSATERLKEIWMYESKRLPENITDESAVEFEDLIKCLPDVLSRLEYPVENGTSDDRIDYENEAKIYIVVGGSVLARGLTLEGLMVSYFLRSTTQYDTLLQMGRWFGYRFGYEDLPRIWMTEDLQEAFRILAGVEAEIRQDIREYAKRSISPMEFAVRIKSTPGMAITSAAKMRNAVTCDITYAGKHVQTIRYQHNDKAIIDSNWKSADQLLNDAADHGKFCTQGSNIVYRGVPVRIVRKFLQQYKVHEKHRELSADFLLKYIDKTGKGLSSWNIGLFSPINTTKKFDGLIGQIDSPRLVNRSRLASTNSYADIKALMSRKDILWDCPEIDTYDPGMNWDELKDIRKKAIGDVPLLLIYLINKDSSKSEISVVREDLNALDHLVGFGIVFPGDSGGGNYVSVELEDTSADELESLEEQVSDIESQGNEL